ncbi:MAG: cyclic nucleotide-binding domain-containing protein [Patescibacteria group bacterium]
MFQAPDLYIFDGLSEEEVNYFLLMSEPMEFRSGDTIIVEGDESDNRAYLLESGEVVISIDGKEITRLTDSGLFGEIALITNDVRTATVTAVNKVRVLAIQRDEFLMLVKKSGNFESVQKEIFRRIQSNFAREQE